MTYTYLCSHISTYACPFVIHHMKIHAYLSCCLYRSSRAYIEAWKLTGEREQRATHLPLDGLSVLLQLLLLLPTTGLLLLTTGLLLHWNPPHASVFHGTTAVTEGDRPRPAALHRTPSTRGDLVAPVTTSNNFQNTATG